MYVTTRLILIAGFLFYTSSIIRVTALICQPKIEVDFSNTSDGQDAVICFDTEMLCSDTNLTYFLPHEFSNQFSINVSSGNCLNSIASAADPVICINISAQETENENNTSNFEVCIIFNQPPVFGTVTEPNIINVAVTSLPLNISIPLNIKPDKINTFTVTELIPNSFENNFNAIDKESIITFSGSPKVENVSEIVLNVSVTDSGQPPLTANSQFYITLLNEKITCDNIDIIYIEIGESKEYSLDCTSLANNSISYTAENTSSLPFLVELHPNGSVFVNSNKNKTIPPNRYNLSIKATTIMDIQFSVELRFDFGRAPVCDNVTDTLVLSRELNTNLSTPITCYNDQQNPSNEPSADINSEAQAAFDLITVTNTLAMLLEIQIVQKTFSGPKQLVINVSNNYGSTFLTFNLARPPKFTDTQSQFSVLETVQSGTVIHTFSVDDPDPEAGELVVFDTFDKNAEIPFAMTENNFSVTKSLNASEVTKYFLSVKVIDTTNLTDTMNITVSVNDTNNIPYCAYTDNVLTLSLDKLQTPGHLVTLACFDSDVDTDFKTLTFQFTSESNQQFVDFFQFGDPPSELLLNKTLADKDLPESNVIALKVKISDNGQPSLFIELSINIQVFDNRPFCPISNLHLEISEMSQVGECFNVSHNCTDPTLAGLSFSFNSTGNSEASTYLAIRELPGIVNDMAFCLTKSVYGKPDTYKSQIMVVNRNHSTLISLSLIVEDINEVPTFVNLPEDGLFTVMENTAIGTSVISITANDVDSNTTSFGQYSIYINPVSPDQQHHFNFTEDTFIVAEKLSAAQQMVYTFNVEAVDGGELSVSTVIKIQIIDVNESPVCSPVMYTSVVEVVAPVGTHITNISCTDPDVYDNYTTIIYKIEQPYSYLFNMSDRGEVILANMLPLDQDKHNITITVFNDIDKNIFTSVSVIITVNRSYPPSCSASAEQTQLKDTDSTGTCGSSLITCTSPVHGGLSIEVAGNLTANVDVQVKNTTSGITLQICVISSLRDSIGKYQVNITVENQVQQCKYVTWLLTVVDENEPPVFQQLTYNIAVNETVANSSTILSVDIGTGMTFSETFDGKVIEIKDPDVHTDSNQIKNIAADPQALSKADNSVVQLTDFPIKFNRSAFFVTGTLSESLIYTFNITITDGGGLTASAMLIINVNDINEAPVCTTSSVTVDKTLLLTEDKTIVKLSCTDDDYQESYKVTEYRCDGQDKEYFRISSRGIVDIVDRLPRDKDLLNFSAVAVDAADSNLVYVVNIVVNVNRDIPATCQVTRFPPVTWVISSCYNITLGCIDPTTGDTSTLSYKFSGNYTSGFNFTETDGSIILCYTKTESGMYTINTEVDNGLKVANLKELIEVQYERSTPVFLNIPIQKTVINSAEVGSVLFNVTAKTTGQFAGNIIYSLLKSNPVSAIDAFDINSNTGEITAKKALKDLIGKNIDLYIQALDERSRLKASAEAVITVDEKNLKPICPERSAKDTINIDMTESVNKVIAKVNCTDMNFLSKYNTLTYQTQGTNKYFVVDSATGEVKIADQLPFKDTHVLFVEASDGQETDRTTLVINVNIKLRPVITVDDVSTTSVKIMWKFDRSDYTQYLVKYTLKWEAGDNTVGNTDIDRDRSDFLLDQLKPGTHYFIVLTSMAQDFNVSEPVSVTTKEIPVLSQITMEFKVTNEEWNAAFLDKTSAKYKEFKNKTEINIRKALITSSGIHKVAVLNLRKGSVIVDAVVSVNQSGNVSDTRKTLVAAITGGQMGDATVDSKYYSFYSEDHYAVIKSVEVAQRNPAEITQDSTTSVICSARLVGQGLTPLFSWKLNKSPIHADLSSRLNVTLSNTEGDSFGFTSVITFRPITLNDRGDLECSLTNRKQTVTSVSKSITLKVIAKPEVTLLPMTLYIRKGQVGTLNCSVESKTDYTVTWHINGNKVENTGAIRMNNYVLLNIRNINDDAKYTCLATNIAGVVTSNIAVVGPFTEKLFCAARTNNRGISWPHVPAGKMAEAPCTGNYKGSAKQLCLSNGVWQNLTDLTNCKLEALVDLAERAEAKREGIDSESTEAIMNNLANLTSSETLASGDIDVSIKIIEDVIHANERDTKKKIKNDEIKDMVKAADNMLSTSKNEWRDLHIKKKRGAAALMKSLDAIGHLASQRAEGLVGRNSHIANNLVLEYGKSNASDIEFPRLDYFKYPPWMKETQTRAYLKSVSYIKAPEGTAFQGYSGVCYKDMSDLVQSAEPETSEDSNAVSKKVNSLILSFSLNPPPAGKLDPPLKLTFQHLSENFSDPSCGFMNYSPPYQTTGHWSTEGCVVVTKSDNVTVCECDHLTNFAILMSPGKTSEKTREVLSIISAIGCAISIFCLVLTVGIYIVLWRYVKTEKPDRVIILMNLCVVLIIAYLLFLLGINRTEYVNVCTVISVLLHYFYLVVFFLMLAEGIELFVCVIYVFNLKSRLRWLMVMSWGFPAVIVGISIGITKLKGYGNDDFCWLSLDEGLLWAFVGPALSIIVINFIIVIIVLKTMFSTTAMMTKDAKEKGKAGLKGLCVLLPVMGLTWVFGVFSVNEDLEIFQYLFAVFNSLQGLFIFIFHCLLSRQVKDGMKNRKRRYLASSVETKSTYSQQNILNRKTSDDTSADSDLDKKVSPFLEADRQVQQIADKLSKVEKENFLDKEDCTKIKTADTVDKVNVLAETQEIKEVNKAENLEMRLIQEQQQQEQNVNYYKDIDDFRLQSYRIPEQRIVHKSLQQESSIEENILQTPPGPKPYRQSMDGKEPVQKPKKTSVRVLPFPNKSLNLAMGCNMLPPTNLQEDREFRMYESRKRRDEIYNALKQSQREDHPYTDLQTRYVPGCGPRRHGNSDSSLHEQKYKGCDLPLYMGPSEDKWIKHKQALEMRHFSNHPGPLSRAQQRQIDEDLAKYNYYKPFTGVRGPERRLPRTRFSDDDIRFEEPMSDYNW